MAVTSIGADSRWYMHSRWCMHSIASWYYHIIYNKLKNELHIVILFTSSSTADPAGMDSERVWGWTPAVRTNAGDRHTKVFQRHSHQALIFINVISNMLSPSSLHHSIAEVGMLNIFWSIWWKTRLSPDAFKTGCVTSHISLFGAQLSGASTRFYCLCVDDEIRTKRWRGYGLTGTRLSFYLAKPKPAQIKIRRDCSPTLSSMPQYYLTLPQFFHLFCK